MQQLKITKAQQIKLSILIPTLGEECLYSCLKAIKKYSKHTHEICIHYNARNNDSLSRLRAYMDDEFAGNFILTSSELNLGVCVVNNLAKLATSQYIMYLNDDENDKRRKHNNTNKKT